MVCEHTFTINEGRFYRNREDHLNRYDELRLHLYDERNRFRRTLLTRNPGRHEKAWLIERIRAIDFTLLNFRIFTETICGSLH